MDEVPEKVGSKCFASLSPEVWKTAHWRIIFFRKRGDRFKREPRP
jgi:hypothetical protein